jgi:adenosylcobinamide-phosphate guanylyltransferase
MGGGIEKPLLEISGKSMLERTIGVLRQCSCINRIVVASSSNTPRTTLAAKKLGVENVVTPGSGFEEDMRFAVRQLSLGEVLVISSDLPFVTVDIIEQAARKYRSSGKPALAVMARAELYEKLGSKPGYIFKIDDQNLVPVGINVIDGSRIDEGALDQVELVITSGDIAFNVNTLNELEAARKKARRHWRKGITMNPNEKFPSKSKGNGKHEIDQIDVWKR